MPDYTESDLQNALQDIRKGVSQRKASLEWGVPRSTLQELLDGVESRRDSHQWQQRLSRSQEDDLVSWIRIQAEVGAAPTHQQIKAIAERILQNGGDNQPLGQCWMQNFLARNPSVRTIRGKRIDSQRVNGASIENIRRFFDYLNHPTIQQIRPEYRFNMDEAGIMEGEGKNGLVVGPSNRSQIYIASSQSRTWVTLIECISATGQYLPPLVIFKGKNV